MLLLTALALIAVALAAPCVATEVITLPLELGNPQLYIRAGDDYRLDFDAERELLDISDVRLHVVGTYDRQRSICWYFGNFGGGTWSYTEDTGLYIGFQDAETVVCVTQHVFEPAESGTVAYDLELTFYCSNETADWAFLSQGIGIVYLTGLACDYFPEYPEVCICEHSVMVTSAELIIELGSGVAVERGSWGTVKDRYR